MKKERKHYTGEEEVAVLRRHLVGQVPVSELRDKLGLQPTVFYGWQKEFFENGAAAFQKKERSSAGTNRSKESASGRERRCRWRMPGVWPASSLCFELCTQ